MSAQNRGISLSLVCHLFLIALLIGGGHLLDSLPQKPLLIDLSLSLSEAMAGEPGQVPGASPADNQAAAPQPPPQATPSPPPEPEPETQPEPQPEPKAVHVVKPKPKKKPAKVHRQPPKPKVNRKEPPAQQPEQPAQAPVANTASTGTGQSTAPSGQKTTGQSGHPGEGQPGGGSKIRYDFSYVRQRIMHNLHFPDEARREGLTGTIIIAFDLLANGDVSNIAVLTSSGHAILDETVTSTIRRVAPFPKPPVPVRLKLPIVFHLK